MELCDRPPIGGTGNAVGPTAPTPTNPSRMPCCNGSIIMLDLRDSPKLVTLDSPWRNCQTPIVGARSLWSGPSLQDEVEGRFCRTAKSREATMPSNPLEPRLPGLCPEASTDLL